VKAYATTSDDPPVSLDVETPGMRTVDVRVKSITWECARALSLVLIPSDSRPLLPFDPGAHIDVQIPCGPTRQYSLCGAFSDTAYYRIAVREILGGVASEFFHRRLRVGDLLAISPPRNNFRFKLAPKYLFIAGGIGITPLLPMMHSAPCHDTDWTLRYCIPRLDETPFLNEINALQGRIFLHTSERHNRLNVSEALGDLTPDTLVYCCGPDRLMEAVKSATAGWPQDMVNYEWFKPQSSQKDAIPSSIKVICERSNKIVEVTPDQTILAALIAAGIDVPKSCEQGICGTCELGVLKGEVDHRDSILSPSERQANSTMMVCVSRAKGSTLVLDI
jgi:ferredoxin-NADP reductase